MIYSDATNKKAEKKKNSHNVSWDKGENYFSGVVYRSLVVISAHFHVEGELTAHLKAREEI